MPISDRLPDYQPERLGELVPEHLHGGLRRYIEQGLRPGGALWAILCNGPAFSVLAKCDDEVAPRLRDIYRFLYTYAPGRCWGTQELCEAWLVARSAVVAAAAAEAAG